MKEVTEENILKILTAFDTRLVYQEAALEALVNVVVESGIIEQEDFNQRAIETYNEIIKERQIEVDKIEAEMDKSKTPIYYGPTGEA